MQSQFSCVNPTSKVVGVFQWHKRGRLYSTLSIRLAQTFLDATYKLIRVLIEGLSNGEFV